MEVTDHCVVFGTHTSGSWLSGKKTDFTEEISAFEGTNEGVTFLDGILNENFTFTMLDEEESVIFFTLVNQWILRVEQHQLQ